MYVANQSRSPESPVQQAPVKGVALQQDYSVNTNEMHPVVIFACDDDDDVTGIANSTRSTLTTKQSTPRDFEFDFTPSSTRATTPSLQYHKYPTRPVTPLPQIPHPM